MGVLLVNALTVQCLARESEGVQSGFKAANQVAEFIGQGGHPFRAEFNLLAAGGYFTRRLIDIGYTLGDFPAHCRALGYILVHFLDAFGHILQHLDSVVKVSPFRRCS